MESKKSLDTMAAPNLSEHCIKTVNSHRVLFAHMSVGSNILDGLSAKNRSIKEQLLIKIIEPASSGKTYDQGINHIKIGANSQPYQKLSNFREFLAANDNGRLFDLVGIKFCYVDVTRKTDIHALFKTYDALVKDMQERYPHIKFVHFTVPLTTHYSSLKNRIKTLILGDQDNIKRNAFNELLCATYKKQEIIDIARIESTFPNGSRMQHSYFLAKHYSLIPAYTTDGGHLNDLGKTRVAAEFIGGICKALSD